MAETRAREREAAPQAASSDTGAGAQGAATQEQVFDQADDVSETRVQEELAALGQLADDVRGWFGSSVTLMGTEARLFLASLLMVVALAAMVGLLVAGAVIFLGAAGVLMLVREGGISPALAALIGATALSIGAAAVYFWIRRVAREMGFVRTRKSWAALFGSASAAADREKEK